MDITTTYMGMTLRSPLVVSASPLSEDLGRLRRMEDAGAAAVVLYSLFEEQITLEQIELDYHLTSTSDVSAESIDFFPEQSHDFEMGAEQYLRHIEHAKEAVDIPIIASLNGATPGGWTKFAAQIAAAGADALELNIYRIPTDPDLSSADVEQEYIDIVSAVKSAVEIPVAVKISPFFSNMAYMARRLDEAGADALVLFNRFYQPDIDIEALEVYPHVLLSTSQALRLPLRWIGILNNRIQADLAATSGIHNAEDVVKMLMVGANVTMMASALMKNGIEHISTLEAALIRWLIDHEYDSVAQMRGSMAWQNKGNAGAFERAQYMKAVSSLPPHVIDRR